MKLDLEGFIDIIESDDTIVEFKTSSQTMDMRSVNDSVQLTAYSYAYEMLYQKPLKSLKVINFVKTEKPKMIPLKTKRSKADHQMFYYLAREVLKGIESQVFFPRPSFMCKDCEYEKHCKGWNGN